MGINPGLWNFLLTQAQKQKVDPGLLGQVSQSADPTLDQTDYLKQITNPATSLPSTNLVRDLMSGTTPKPGLPSTDPSRQPLTGKNIRRSESFTQPVAIETLQGAQDTLGPALYAANKAFPTGMEESQDAVKYLRDIVSKFPTEQRADLSALGDFANYATRGQYKSSYKPPQSLEELMKDKASIAALAARAAEGPLGESGRLVLGQLAARMGGAASMAQASDEQKKEEADLAKFVSSKVKDFNTSKPIEGILQTKSFAGKVRSLLDEGTAADDANVVTLLVRMRSDVGNAAEWEQKIGTNFGSLPQSVKNSLEKMWTGKYSDFTRNELQDMVDTFEREANKGYNNFARHAAKQEMAVPYPGLTEDKLYKAYLGGFSGLGGSGARKNREKAPETPTKMTDEQKLEYYRSLDKKEKSKPKEKKVK